jgi:hypothetical protein
LLLLLFTAEVALAEKEEARTETAVVLYRLQNSLAQYKSFLLPRYGEHPLFSA